DMDAFAHLPISYEGRVMPLDSLARNSLRIISGKATFKDGEHSREAIDWLADALAGREHIGDYRVFRVDHPEIKSELGLNNPRPRMSFFKSLLGLDDSQTRFSFNQIVASEQKLQDQLKLIENVPAKERDLYQRKLIELW